MSATKADLERARYVEPVDISKWMPGKTGYVCDISAGNVLNLPGENDSKAGDDGGDAASEHDALYQWVVLCFCNEHGQLVFEDNKESRTFLADRPFGMVKAISDAAMKVQGIGEEGQQATAKN